MRNSSFVYLLLLAVLCSMQDLSSLTGDGTPGPWQGEPRVLTPGPPGTFRPTFLPH